MKAFIHALDDRGIVFRFLALQEAFLSPESL